MDLGSRGTQLTPELRDVSSKFCGYTFFVDTLPHKFIDALKTGQVIHTQLGLFYTEILAREKALNQPSRAMTPTSGQIIPGFLPSDSFSQTVLHKNFLSQLEIWSQIFSKKTLPLPNPTVNIEIDQNRFISIQNSLRDDGTTCLDEYGTLDLEEFPRGNTTHNLWMISFSPSDRLRGILNPSG